MSEIHDLKNEVHKLKLQNEVLKMKLESERERSQKLVEALEILRTNLKWDHGNSLIIEEALKGYRGEISKR